MAKYRYPGAQPFSSTQEDIFFGREQDIEALYRLIRLEPLVVLYAKSGLGKSSLLNAGVVPEVLKDGKYLPINIRFNAYNIKGESVQLPLDSARLAIAAACPAANEKTYLERLLPPEDSLWYQLKREQALGNNQQQLLLLFDQFEELFTYPEAAILAFKQQLAEVLHTQIPQRFRALVEGEVEHPTILNREELALLHQPFAARIVFAIRADRVSLLDKLADYLPDVKRSWYELDALRQEQAEDAILNPAYKRGAFASPIFDYDDGAIEQMLDFLTQGRSQKIESFQLQILCQAIERKVIRQGLTQVTAADLGNIEEVYENYYDDQVKSITDPADQLAARRFIEEGLIFEEEERRLSLYEGQIYRQYGISEDLLRQLEDTHLIRREPSMKGGYTYELSHDTLVAPVLRAKEQRLAAERQALAEADRLRQDQELAEAQQKAAAERQLRQQAESNEKRARQRTRLAMIVSLLALLLAIFAGWSYFQAEAAKVKANESADLAAEKTKEAETERSKAEVDRQAALASRDSTKEALLLADSLQTKAKAEAEKAKRALTDKEAYSRQAMPVLLKDIENLILRMLYDTALVRCQIAWNLDPKNREVARYFQEIAFFFTESQAYPKAEAALAYMGYKPGQLNQQSGLYRQDLLSAVQRIDSKWFLDTLQTRYYGDMVNIEGGSFCMGRDPEVTGPCDTIGVEVLLDDFRLARTEVTVWQYHLYCEASGHDSLDRIQARLDWELQGDFPIVKVSWYDAARYANWLNQQMGQDTLYNFVRPLGENNWEVSLNPGIKNAFRLPTEAEWEYAARGGVNKDNTTYSSSDNLDEVAWYDNNSAGRTHAVAGKKANGLGLYDLSGNVWEWCWDWHQHDLEPGNNPLGPVSGTRRVVRGGSWFDYDLNCSVSFRFWDNANFRYSRGIGFRVARY